MLSYLKECLLVVALAATSSSHAAPNTDALRGNLAVHDPSTIVECEGEYWLFATGHGVQTRRSKDLIRWETGPRVFTNVLAWATNAVPGFRGHIWAPDIVRLGNRYCLYYSVSTWGSPVSAIGMASTPTLNPAGADYGWTDHGPVVRSSQASNYNAIDPAVYQDADGSLWMAFGSFWSGIQLLQLDAKTGLRLDPESPVTRVAWKEAIEAPGLLRRGNFYYLFVNWGQCCRGTNSTYNIRVGRSATIQGPYLDREGRDMVRGWGTLVLNTEGQHIGPGHPSFLQHEGKTLMSYHFYNGAQNGLNTLGLLPVHWDEAGWPKIEYPRGAN